MFSAGARLVPERVRCMYASSDRSAGARLAPERVRCMYASSDRSAGARLAPERVRCMYASSDRSAALPSCRNHLHCFKGGYFLAVLSLLSYCSHAMCFLGSLRVATIYAQ